MASLANPSGATGQGLQSNAWEKDSSRKNHIPGIHPALARTYINHLTRNGKSVPRTIIVGQHAKFREFQVSKSLNSKNSKG